MLTVRRTATLALLGLVGLGGAIGCSKGASEGRPAPPAAAPRIDTLSSASADPIFAASFKDLDRDLQPMEQWRGKVLLVYFWATWCKPCRTEVPALIALYDEYRARDVAIVGIAIDQTDQVRRFAEEYGINYDVLIGGNDALDLSREMGNGLGGLPFLVVIDREGNVVTARLGEITLATLEEMVAPLVG